MAQEGAGELVCTLQRRILVGEFERVRGLFAALGDQTRQTIFVALLENAGIGMRVGDVALRAHLSRPAASHQLKVLKDAGLVECVKIGTRIYYFPSAAASQWEDMKVLVDHVGRLLPRARAAGYPRIDDGWGDGLFPNCRGARADRSGVEPSSEKGVEE